MKTLVCASFFALAAAGCASNDADRASSGASALSAPVSQGASESNPRPGDNASAGARPGDRQARRDNQDSRPGSRELEETR